MQLILYALEAIDFMAQEKSAEFLVADDGGAACLARVAAIATDTTVISDDVKYEASRVLDRLSAEGGGMGRSL